MLLAHHPALDAPEVHPPLAGAISTNNLEIATLLIDAGTEVNGTAYDRPLLAVAADQGFLQIAKLLVAHGAKLEATSPHEGPAICRPPGAGTRTSLRSCWTRAPIPTP